MSRRIYLWRPDTDHVVSVTTGFNWWACLLGPLWAIAKKQWLIFFWLLVGNTALTAVNVGLAWAHVPVGLVTTINLVSSLLFAAFCGYYANLWHLRALKRKGYQIVPASTQASQ